MSFLVIIVILLLLMWVMLVRPQRRKQSYQQQMLRDLAAGDEILTAGGMYATVRSVEGDDVTVEISPGTEVRLAKRAVAAVIPPDAPEVEATELEGDHAADSGSKYGFDAGDESTSEKRS